MKKFVLPILMMLSLNGLAFTNEKSNAGEKLRLEFRKHAAIAANTISYYQNRDDDSCLADLPGKTCNLLIKTLYGDTGAKPSVIFVNVPLIEKGQEVDALNVPAQQLIKVNIARWNTLKKSEKVALVFHETSGAIGLKIDINYSYSRFLQEYINSESKTMSCSAQCVYTPDRFGVAHTFYTSNVVAGQDFSKIREDLFKACIKWMNKIRSTEAIQLKPVYNAPADMALVTTEWLPGKVVQDYPVTIDNLDRDCRKQVRD